MQWCCLVIQLLHQRRWDSNLKHGHMDHCSDVETSDDEMYDADIIILDHTESHDETTLTSPEELDEK